LNHKAAPTAEKKAHNHRRKKGLQTGLANVCLWRHRDRSMKTKIAIGLLVVLCLGLGIAWLVRHNQAVEEQKVATDSILSLSNRLVKTSVDLSERDQTILNLEKDLTATNAFIAKLTNDLSQTATSLAKTAADLEAARKNAEAEIARRDARIATLEAQNQTLDKQALELSTAITNLNTQITETQRKLAAAEGDKTFLEGELKRLMTEKADLERKFSDLEVLRAQVKNLKEELSIARRIEWIRKGLFPGADERGASRLMEKPKSPAAGTEKPPSDLNVEVGSDGSVRVIPPPTNSPAGTNPPPK